MQLKNFLIVQDEAKKFHVWSRLEYGDYMAGCVECGAGSAYKLVTHFDGTESLLSPTPALEGEKEWVSVKDKMQKPICINGVSPNLCDSIRRNQGMQSCECLIYQKYLKTELNQEKGEVLAYHEKWIDPDFNPDGIRTGFIGGDGAFISAKWCDSGDTYENDEEFMPTHYKAKPLPPKTDNP